MKSSIIIPSTIAALAATVGASTNYNVTVGKDGQLKFVPEVLSGLNIGDTVTYHFFSKNHSVVQSNFDNPCKPLDGGFFSAFVPQPVDGVESATTWTITLNDTKPIWIYCSQGQHCKQGMVQSINADPTGDKTHDAFKSLAAKVDGASVSPASPLPVGGVRLTTVQVGSGTDLIFSPNNITEPPHTVVRFLFNPANHSVVQSSFDDPCQPLANDTGFSSGFVPTQSTPSGVAFDVVVKDASKPVWFYCAQPGGGGHCQKGMVGSINAPTVGNTLQAFTDKAKASQAPSGIPPDAPRGGVLSFNGTAITSVGGNVLNITALSPAQLANDVPLPGDAAPPYIVGMAGGDKPANYGWAPEMSDTATAALQLLQFIDNVLITLLFAGHELLTGGGSTSWAGAYPDTITSSLGSMAAQTYIHRRTATDCLQHYEKTLMGSCTYTIATNEGDNGTIDDFLTQVLHLVLLEIGLLIDTTASVAATDSWLIPALATQLGAKSRMAALINLMQGHGPAAAPREVQIPPRLVYSYVRAWYVSSCTDGSEEIGGQWGDVLPKMEVLDKEQEAGEGRVVTVTLKVDKDGVVTGDSDSYVAWIGPWGGVEYTSLSADGVADVPTGLYGHVWAVVTKGKDKKLNELADIATAGPALVWITQP